MTINKKQENKTFPDRFRQAVVNYSGKPALVFDCFHELAGRQMIEEKI
jgi:hypothetical protein